MNQHPFTITLSRNGREQTKTIQVPADNAHKARRIVSGYIQRAIINKTITSAIVHD